MATNTYVALDTKVLTGTASTVVFSSIPATYTDLVLVMNTKGSAVTNNYIQVNSDTSSNYSRTGISGNGSAASSYRGSNQTKGYLDNNAGTDTTEFRYNDIIHFMNYSNTTTYKTILNRANNAALGVEAQAILWRSTSAINSITVGMDTGTYSIGSTFSLYGVKADTNAYTAKATGGTITADVGYIYHTFTSSGTFTPLQSLTADMLVIAGGGGGGAGTNGSNGGGGGGAGGLLAFTSQALTATGYTITVGAGGTGNGSTGLSTNGGDSQFGALTLVKGGGAGGSNYNSSSANWPGLTGGSGGGGYGRNAAGGSATSGQGYAGGTGGADSGNYAGAGGGGATAVGANGNSGGTAGAGGAGSNSYSSWASATGTGVSGYYAGGGAGGSYSSTAAVGGSGGGGTGGSNAAVAVAGTANTGGGGGASSGNLTGAGTGKNGGSGLVIIRYLKA